MSNNKTLLIKAHFYSILNYEKYSRNMRQISITNSTIFKLFHLHKRILICIKICKRQFLTLSFVASLSFFYLFWKVSWIRKKDYHLLTVGLTTYSSDERFSALHLEESEVGNVDLFDSISNW